MDPYRLSGPRPSLIQRIAAAVIGGVLVVSLFFVGLFASILIVGVAMVASIGLSIWFWRQKRRFAKFRAAHEQTLRDQMGEQVSDDPRRPADQVIEGEFVVRGERTRRGPPD